MRRPILFIGGPADGQVIECDPEATHGTATIYYNEGVECSATLRDDTPLDTSPTPRMIYTARILGSDIILVPEFMDTIAAIEKLTEAYGKKPERKCSDCGSPLKNHEGVCNGADNFEIMKCEDCKFWMKISDAHEVGTCQRHAPFNTGRRRDYIDTADKFSHYFGTNRDWPQTSRGDWCGDFQQKTIGAAP